jgi:hypothetical protein
MNHELETLEGLLTQLGRARKSGAFGTGSKAYPWQADRRSSASRSAHRFQRSWSWARVAVPVAAAAAVAVLFVVPGLIGNHHDKAGNSFVGVSPEAPKSFADASSTNPGRALTSGRAPDCDYNGDGVIDGRDIQALVDQLRDSDGDALIKADYLQRCLLGS